MLFLRLGLIGQAHCGEAVAEGVTGEAQQARGLALVGPPSCKKSPVWQQTFMQ
jgi:hypothetical protein